MVFDKSYGPLLLVLMNNQKLSLSLICHYVDNDVIICISALQILFHVSSIVVLSLLINGTTVSNLLAFLGKACDFQWKCLFAVQLNF